MSFPKQEFIKFIIQEKRKGTINYPAEKETWEVFTNQIDKEKLTIEDLINYYNSCCRYSNLQD